jgi:hypothetical protein
MNASAGSAVFDFESDSERTLDYIPMCVRMKLDLCGVKMSLAQWIGLPLAVRQIILEARCQVDPEIRRVRHYLEFIVDAFGLGPLAPVRCDPQAWRGCGRAPSSVVAAMAALGYPSIGAAAWDALNDLQRFALIKLARPGHTRHLADALEEFGLATRPLGAARAER